MPGQGFEKEASEVTDQGLGVKDFKRTVKNKEIKLKHGVILKACPYRAVCVHLLKVHKDRARWASLGE